MGAIIGIAVAYLLILAGVFFFQRSLMYYPPKDQPDLSAYPGLGLEAVTLTTADGLDLKAWYRPADRPELPTVVYFHGNAGHIGDRVPKYRPFMEAGYGALLVEYRGYGGNPGKPTEAGLTADAQAAMAFALAQGIEPGRIVVHGESLGTGLAVKMAAAHPVAAVVLEAPPGSIAEVAQAHYWYLPAKWLTLDRWDVFPLLEQVKAPILLLHGDADRTVPQRFGRRLYEAIPGPKQAIFLEGGGHTDLLDYPQVEARIFDFLGEHAVAVRPASEDVGE